MVLRSTVRGQSMQDIFLPCMCFSFLSTKKVCTKYHSISHRLFSVVLLPLSLGTLKGHSLVIHVKVRFDFMLPLKSIFSRKRTLLFSVH